MKSFKRRARIFIAYGTDHKARDILMQMIKSFGLIPVVFSKTPDLTKSVIEKFESEAKRCEFAIILLTPDDKRIMGRGLINSVRPRQNVIFEMGWFFGFLNRTRTLLLRKGDLELPSDIRGVLYKRYTDSPAELRDEIKRALRAGGVRLDR